MSTTKSSRQKDLIPYTQGETVALIALERIDTAAQVRTDFDEQPMAELAADIKAKGVLQPIIVRQVEEGRFLIVAGERRFRAASMAELKVIPALVREISQEQAEDMQLAENIQREELGLMDTANAVRRLFDREKSLGKVGAIVNKSKSWVSKHLALTMDDLGRFAQGLLRDGSTEDMEILHLVRKAENDFGTMAAWGMCNAIREGKMNRAKAREHLKELKKEAEAKAEKKETEEDEEEEKNQEKREKAPWQLYEDAENELADVQGEQETPDFPKILAMFSETEQQAMLEEERVKEFYEEGRAIKEAKDKGEPTVRRILMLGRKCWNEWDRAAVQLGAEGHQLTLDSLIREFWSNMQ